MTLKAFLFDLDGTLVDSDPIHTSVFIDFLGARGVPLTAADYTARIHGRQNTEIFAEFLPHEDARAMDLAKEAAYRERIGTRMDTLPGAGAFIARLRARGLATAAVTNAPRANLEAVLFATGLTNEFDFKISADEVARGKPDPEVYLAALSALKVTAEEAVVFEDSPSGIAAGRAAGIRVIGVATSLAAQALLDHGASYVIRDFTDPGLTRHLALPEGAAT